MEAGKKNTRKHTKAQAQQVCARGFLKYRLICKKISKKLDESHHVRANLSHSGEFHVPLTDANCKECNSVSLKIHKKSGILYHAWLAYEHVHIRYGTQRCWSLLLAVNQKLCLTCKKKNADDKCSRLAGTITAEELRAFPNGQCA